MPLLVLTAAAWLWQAALLRSRGLLTHDEAISLISPAGTARQVDALYSSEERLGLYRADQLQALLRPSPDSEPAQVLDSLANYDVHPPLYFMVLHGLQRLGLTRHAWLRLPGIVALILGAIVAHRLVWPDGPFAVRCLATAWLLVNPVLIETATELRQYGFVLLGMILALAGLIAHFEGRTADRKAILLLTLAPVLMLWSQVGTAVWVACALFVACIPARRNQPGARRRLTWALVIAAAVCLPLAWWWLTEAHGLGPADSIPLARVGSELLVPILSSLGKSWCSLPGRLHGSAVWSVIACCVLGLAFWAIVAGRNVLDRLLLCAALGWGAIWFALLWSATLPAHALEPKHLFPLVLCPWVLLVRAACTSPRRWVRPLALAAMIGSLVAHGLGAVQWAQARSLNDFAGRLQAAECLIATSPRRGYLMPLVDRMSPAATVVIAAPNVALEHWSQVEPELPTDDLLVAAIGRPRGDDQQSAMRRLLEVLAAEYSRMREVRNEPVRTVTAFGRRRQPSEAP